MDAKRYYTGFTLTAADPLVINIGPDNDGLSYSVTVDAGDYYHDLNDGAGYVDLVSTLIWLVNAAAVTAGSTVTYDVRWRNYYPRYEITPSVGTITVTANAVAQRVLGIAASVGAGTQLLSSFVPWYVIVPQVDGVSQSTGDFQDGDGIVAAAITDGGQQFGVKAVQPATRHDWVQPFEVYQSTYGYAASAAAPFTFDRMFDHVGAQVPIVIVNTAADWPALAPATAYDDHAVIRFKLLADAALFTPRRVVPSLDTLWDVPFGASILERQR